MEHGGLPAHCYTPISRFTPCLTSRRGSCAAPRSCRRSGVAADAFHTCCWLLPPPLAAACLSRLLLLVSICLPLLLLLLGARRWRAALVLPARAGAPARLCGVGGDAGLLWEIFLQHAGAEGIGISAVGRQGVAHHIQQLGALQGEGVGGHVSGHCALEAGRHALPGGVKRGAVGRDALPAVRAACPAHELLRTLLAGKACAGSPRSVATPPARRAPAPAVFQLTLGSSWLPGEPAHGCAYSFCRHPRGTLLPQTAPLSLRAPP